jgi:hypothetical protein
MLEICPGISSEALEILVSQIGINILVSDAQAVQRNGSLYVHAYFIRSGHDIDTPSEELPPDSIFHKSHSKCQEPLQEKSESSAHCHV